MLCSQPGNVAVRASLKYLGLALAFAFARLAFARRVIFFAQGLAFARLAHEILRLRHPRPGFEGYDP